MPDYFIGLDLGTTSVKACAFNRAGHLLGECIQTYELLEPTAGAAIQDPEAILGAAADVLRRLARDRNAAPAGIGLSTAMHSVILLDEHYAPLGPVVTWADRRATVDHFSESAKRTFLRRTGTPVHPMSPLVKLPWLAATAPDRWARTAYVGDLKSLLVHRWTEDGFLLDTNLASATGLYDIHARNWWSTALEKAGITQTMLPQVVPATHRLQWRGAIAEQLGVPPDCPFFIGGADGCLANLGSGLMEPGQIALTIGTSGAVRLTHRSPQTDPSLGLFNYHLLGDYYVLGGASNNGGKPLEWVYELMGASFNDLSEMIEAAARVDAAGLTFRPYLYGERAPIYDATATAAFEGVSGRHQPVHFVRAVLDGVTENLLAILRQLVVAYGAPDRLVASGGFTRSDWWVEQFARRSGYEVTVADTPQASAYGAALMARIGLGEITLAGANSAPE